MNNVEVARTDDKMIQDLFKQAGSWEVLIDGDKVTIVFQMKSGAGK